MPRLWFADEVESFSELDALMDRFNVKSCVIDALPETHLARRFAMSHPGKVWLAQYDRHQPGHERERGKRDVPNRYHINRLEALDEMFERLRDGTAELPRDARALGGHVKEGLGAHYRQLLVPTRTFERNGQGNVVAKWVDHNRDDHFAHTELYCMMAGKIYGGRILRVIRF